MTNALLDQAISKRREKNNKTNREKPIRVKALQEAIAAITDAAEDYNDTGIMIAVCTIETMIQAELKR